MMRSLDTLRLVGAYSLLAMGGAAAAHEGHDHDMPSGLWPEHAEKEEQAEPAIYTALESNADLDQRITSAEQIALDDRIRSKEAAHDTRVLLSASALTGRKLILAKISKSAAHLDRQ